MEVLFGLLSRLFTVFLSLSRQGARVWVRDASCVWKEATLKADYVKDVLTVELEDSGEVSGRRRANHGNPDIDVVLTRFVKYLTVRRMRLFLRKVFCSYILYLPLGIPSLYDVLSFTMFAGPLTMSSRTRASSILCVVLRFVPDLHGVDEFLVP